MLLLVCALLAVAPPPAAPPGRVQLTMDTSEAEAVLAILAHIGEVLKAVGAE